MTTETEAVAAAAADVTHALSRFVKALDDVGDDGEAARHLPDGFSAALERLDDRISAAEGLAG